MPPDVGTEMKMRGGQGTRVSSTAALTAFDPRGDGNAVQPHMVDASTFVFSNPSEGELAFACALSNQQILSILDPKGNKKAERIYARLSIPGAEAVEKTVLKLEPGSKWAFLFPSGMAAITTLLLSACHTSHGGDTSEGKIRKDVVIYGHTVYGGTYVLMANLACRFGLHAVAIDMSDLGAVRKAIEDYGDSVGLVYCETPANPTMEMVDIKAVAKLLSEKYDEAGRPVFGVDNTFAGIFQHPLKLGADVVAYSATKYMGGHSDLIGGVLVGRDGRKSVMKDFSEGITTTELKAVCSTVRTILGFTPSPEMAHKLFKHLQTYKLRMLRQARIATRVAKELAKHPKVEKVLFPGLLKGRDADLYRTQMSGSSGVITFELKDGTQEASYRFLGSLKIVLLAVSLGYVRSLATHPSSTTHSEIPPKEQMKMGITPGLIRLSVGIEEPKDLIRDLKQALDHV